MEKNEAMAKKETLKVTQKSQMLLMILVIPCFMI
jgi:hypothetical protein